jgi:hypothetical protein
MSLSRRYPQVSAAVANQRCDAILRDHKIATVDRSFYVEACAFDYANTGDVGCVKAYRKTYDGACGAILAFKAQSPYKEVRVEAAVIEKTAGLGYGLGPGLQGGSVWSQWCLLCNWLLLRR